MASKKTVKSSRKPDPSKVGESPKAKGKGAARDKKKLTLEVADKDFRRAWDSKQKLVTREHEDFLFALGEQWSAEDKAKAEAAGFKPYTDNRIAPNLFLLCGLERQNRSEVKAFPEGDEDGPQSEIASALLRHALAKSDFQHESSEQFKDGATAGESHLELYLDYSEDLLNGKPIWRKANGEDIYWDPASRKYSFEDAKFVYKLTRAVEKEDLINLYPEMEKEIEASSGGRVSFKEDDEPAHRQGRDYPKEGKGGDSGEPTEGVFDLVERFYKKMVEHFFIGDKQTGEVTEMESKGAADLFMQQYKARIQAEQDTYRQAVNEKIAEKLAATPEMAGVEMSPELSGAVESELASNNELPPPPMAQNPERYFIIKKFVPEIWCFAYAPGIEEPLADERAWFFPKWKQYPFVTYFARHSTAPLKGEERHLLVQGIVNPVKGAQEKHNKSEMLMLRIIASNANGGWLTPKEAWVDPEKVERMGATPGVNLEYDPHAGKPDRIEPAPMPHSVAEMSAASAQSIKEQLGINADLLASQEAGSGDASGRALALRHKQGLLMVQELFDNLSRTRKRAGKMVLALLGDMYDLETAKKVLGLAKLMELFPPLMIANPDPETAAQQPEIAAPGEDGEPMRYDEKRADQEIQAVLEGDLEKYDVTVGESVASDTKRMADLMELEALSDKMPIPPPVLIRHSQLPEGTKKELMDAFQQMAMQEAAGAGAGAAKPKPKSKAKEA